MFCSENLTKFRKESSYMPTIFQNIDGIVQFQDIIIIMILNE